MHPPPAVPDIKALAVIRHPDGDRILVGDSDPDPRHLPFQRLLGGRIRFGESAASTVERELREELGLKVRAGRFVTMLEVFFSYRGAAGHDIAIVYEAAFEDPGAYERDHFVELRIRLTRHCGGRCRARFPACCSPPTALLRSLSDGDAPGSRA